MLILDTNIWIAALNEDDSQHQKAISVFGGVQEQILIPEYILVEILNILTLRMGKETANEFLEKSLSNDDIKIASSSEEVLGATIQFFLKNSHEKLSFVDQMLLFLANRGHAVKTFDRALAKLLP